jgi:hypothetical protein
VAVKTGPAPHELFALHALLAAEAAAARKMQANMAAVRDRELKLFMQEAVAVRQRRANKIRQLMGGAGILH